MSGENNCNICSEIVESESLADVIQQKCNSVLDWVGDVDVEAVQLNGLLFVNAVSEGDGRESP